MTDNQKDIECLYEMAKMFVKIAERVLDRSNERPVSTGSSKKTKRITPAHAAIAKRRAKRMLAVYFS